MRPSAPCGEPFKRVQLHQSTATIFQIGVARYFAGEKEETYRERFRSGFPRESRERFGACFCLPADAWSPIAAFNDAISTAASAASNPLFPIFRPALSIACSKVSQVKTPKACGTPVSCADCPMPRVTSFTITS